MKNPATKSPVPRWTLILIAAFSIALILWFFAANKPQADSNNTTSEAKATKNSQPSSSQQNKKQLLQGKNRHELLSANKASIRGKVQDPQGHGIAHAHVCAWARSQELASVDRQHAHCTTTSSTGAYHLDNLIGVAHRVGASAAEYIPGVYASGTGIDRREYVNLQAGREAIGIDITLKPGGVKVEGIVKDISGGTLEGAQIVASKTFSDPLAATLSEADGSFHMWVAPGELSLNASLEGYADGSHQGIAPGYRFELFLTPESVIVGKVVSAANGSPVAAAKVTLRESEWFAASDAFAYSNAQGNFRIDRLQPGSYQLSAIADEWYGLSAETVHLGLGQTSQPIVISVHPAFSVSGQIEVGDGSGVCNEGRISLRDASQQRDYAGEPDASGSVLIRGVLPGNYAVAITCQGFLSAENYPPVVVSTQSIQDLRWEVQKGRAIRGVVIDAAGTPVPEITVVARMQADTQAASQAMNAWGYSQRSGDDGSFELRGLRPGTYHLNIWGDRPSPQDPIEVRMNDTEDVNDVRIELSAEGAIRGSVRDSQGNPIPHVHVRLQASRRFFGGQQTSTRDDGSFELAHVPVGRHRVIAVQGWRDTLRAPGTTDDDTQGQEVEVAAGQVAEVELVVESKSGRISGHVVDEAGAPIADAFVDATRESDSKTSARGGSVARSRWGSWSRQPVLTEQDGSFELTELSEGFHTLRAYRKGGGEGYLERVEVGSHNVKIALSPTSSVAGFAHLASGGFPEQFTIEISDSNTGLHRSEQFFRTSGAWSFAQLPPGSYELALTAAEGTAKTTISLQENEQKTGVELTLDPRAKVFGKVVDLDTGEPVPGITVQFADAGGGVSFNFADRKSGKEVTDANGHYEIENAPTGKTRVVTIPANPGKYSFTWLNVYVDPQKKEQELPPLRIIRSRAKRGDEVGDLGFSLKDSEPGQEISKRQWIVAMIRPNGPAAQSELQEGDEIVRVDGHDVTGENAYRYSALTRVKPGTTVTFDLKRGLSIKLVTTKL